MTLLTLSFLVSGCAQKPEIVLVGEARVVSRLDNGNYEVTPAFILWAGDLKNELDLLKLEIKKLREIIETLKDN